MPGQSRLPERTTSIDLRHAGRSRPYLLHVPPERRDPMPLVLQLHGRGVPPLMFDQWTGFSQLADEDGFAVAMPSAIREIWNDGRYREPDWPGRADIDDVGYLLAVLDDATERLAADRARVYVAGMSNGATMAGRLAIECAERIAAVAQVAGTLAADLAAQRRPAVPVPILQIHGTCDRSTPYKGGSASGLWARLILRGRAAPSLGVDDWARKWVEWNGVTGQSDVDVIGADVAVRRWSGANPASDVVFYRIEGGGHTWPGAKMWMPPHLGRVSRSLDATRTIWDFFAAHDRTT